MTVSPLTLFLVDPDPVFRLGLRVWLEQQPEFQVVGEAASSQAALEQLVALQRVAIARATDAGSAISSVGVQVVVVDLGVSQDTPDDMPGLTLCSTLKQQFPDLAIVVLSAIDVPVLRAAAQRSGADGFGVRDLPTRDLARLIYQTGTAAAPVQPAPDPSSAYPFTPEGPIAYLRRTALEEIEAAMSEIEITARSRSPYWYRLVLAGKYRELRAARWLVDRLYPPPSPTAAMSPTSPSMSGHSLTPLPAVTDPFLSDPNIRRSLTDVGESSPETALASVTAPLPVFLGSVRSRVCEVVFRKLQFPLENRSEIPLEIDILRSDKCRELLFTVLKAFENQLDELQEAQVPPGQFAAKASLFLEHLWAAVVVDFFGRYYTPGAEGMEQPLVNYLQADVAIVQAEILSKIPAVPILLSHLLCDSSLDIDGATYPASAPEALRRSQFLLENLVIAVGCAVIQPVLNRYAELESIKRSLYQRRMISSRDVTRFRNDLSWRYRWDSLINEPKAIFESEYRLFALTPEGIRTHTIYAPRQEELQALTGLRYTVTLALEARDAIAPRLRSALSLVGSSVIFVLTEVIGRGIGLIGRGVAKGIGNTWQDIRYRQR
jgi:DNA-binding NarL/FixJ family response regulator